VVEEEPVQQEQTTQLAIQQKAAFPKQTALDFDGNIAIPKSDNSSSSLVQNGINFFTQLISTLQDPEGVRQLAATITQKDEQTGRAWLKLPVENEKTVEKALNLLAALINGYSK
jgi:hypothetical protein